MPKHETGLTPREAECLAVEAEKWLASGNGRKTLEEAFQQAETTSARLAADRVIDIQTIKVPLSI